MNRVQQRPQALKVVADAIPGELRIRPQWVWTRRWVGIWEDLDWKLNKYGELLPEIMDRMERKLAQDALELWSGFAALCAESMGVAAENILAVTLQGGPGTEAVARVEGLKSLARRLGLEPDPEAVEEIRRHLADAWHVVEERGA